MLKNYSPGDTFCGCLAVRVANVSTARNGSSFLDTRLHDGDMEIPAKQWSFAGTPPQENTVIYVEGLMESYQGQPQLIIKQWRPAEPGEFKPQQFIPVSPKPKEFLRAELMNLIKSVKHEGLRSLLGSVMVENLEDFLTCPGAMTHHHNYIGGLAEHSIGVCEWVISMGLEEMNEDLLLAGAILHDIGKIREYDWKGCAITMTTEGRLIGHISLGLMMLAKYIPEVPELNEETANLLLHLIASHHGKLEWGSPVEPKTKEAVILHNADMLDVQMWKIAKAETEAGEGPWTCKVYGINREFYIGTNSPHPAKQDNELSNFEALFGPDLGVANGRG